MNFDVLFLHSTLLQMNPFPFHDKLHRGIYRYEEEDKIDPLAGLGDKTSIISWMTTMIARNVVQYSRGVSITFLRRHALTAMSRDIRGRCTRTGENTGDKSCRVNVRKRFSLTRCESCRRDSLHGNLARKPPIPSWQTSSLVAVIQDYILDYPPVWSSIPLAGRIPIIR